MLLSKKIDTIQKLLEQNKCESINFRGVCHPFNTIKPFHPGMKAFECTSSISTGELFSFL